MQPYDVIIIGGGPAGLTAGLYAARANMRAVLIEAKDVGGQLLNTDLIEDYPGFKSITGRTLADILLEQTQTFGLQIVRYAPVASITRGGQFWSVTLEDGTVYQTLTVIVTVGGSPVKLDVPGEAEFNGRGVSYCAVCDGAFFKGEKLAVIGGGDSAFQEGLFLTRFASELTLVHRRDVFKAQALLQEQLLSLAQVQTITSATVKEIGGDTQVRWLDLEQNGQLKRIEVGGVFIFVGFKPLGRRLFSEHINHDENDHLVTDAFMRTNLPGIYACGDVRAQLARQITTAVGDATTALLHAERYVEEFKHAQSKSTS